MSVEAWASVCGLIVALIGVIVRVERRMGNALTREEHERICAERNTRVERQIADLRKIFEDKHEENRQTNEETRELLRDISRDIRENEVRRSKTEHEIRDSVYALMARVAVTEDRGRPQR